MIISETVKYYNINEIQSLNKQNDKYSLSFFHKNAYSLSKNIEDLELHLDSTQSWLDVKAITEIRIIKNKLPWHFIEIKLANYIYECHPNESPASITLSYIGNHLSYKPRKDLCIYKNVKLVSTLIKLINTKKSNVIIGVIYRHPSMELNDSNDNYLNPLLDKISKERKSIFLFANFSVDLLKYDCHALTNKFFDSLSCHMLLPQIM